MTNKSNAGRKHLPPGQAMTSEIPRVRCLPETRAQYEALGGPEWLRQAIARDYAEKQRRERITTPP